MEPTTEPNSATSNGILMGPKRPFPDSTTLMDYFREKLRSKTIDPASPAILTSSTPLTFDDIDTASQLLALVLRKAIGDDFINQNPDGDNVIGVCVPPSEKLVLLLLGILKLNAAYVPIDASFPEDRIQRVVDIARPILVVTDTEATARDKFDHVKDKSRIVTLTEIWAKYEMLKRASTAADRYQVNSLPTSEPKAESTAIVLFTSGSSGAPKGVRLSHRTVFNRLNWQWERFPFGSTEVACFKTALTFVDSVPEIFGPLLQGIPLVVIPKPVVQQSNLFIQEIQKYRVSRLTVVPSFLESILTLMEISDDGGQSEREALASLTFWICSGEALTHQLLRRFFKHFPHGKTLCNFYGSTEIMGDVTYIDFGSMEDVQTRCVKLPEFEALQVPLGQAIFNSIVYVIDENLQPVSDGNLGEVCISGFNLATGYVGIQDSDKFILNPHSSETGYDKLYRTGDYGQIALTSDGIRVLLFNGRIDSQIKVRGHRVDLSEVEAAIKSLSEVEHGVVLCYHPGQADQAIVAFVVPTTAEVSAAKIAALAQSKLLPYQMPAVRTLEEIPRLVNGKVDRQTLLGQYHEEMLSRDQFDNWDTVGIPTDELHHFQNLVKTISKVTGTPISIIVSDLEATFFELGGTSLNSLTVIAKLKEVNVIVAVNDFVAAKSIRHLHQIIAKPGGVNNESGGQLIAEMLNDGRKEGLIHLIATSFSKKGDLEPHVGARYEDFVPLLTQLWPYLVKAGYSYVVLRDGEPVAACLNFDLAEEPALEPSPGLEPVFNFLEYCEAEQRETLPIPKGKGNCLHNFMMGTHEKMTQAENITLIHFMEEQNIQIGKAHNFQGLLTSNTSLLTQSLAKEVFDYETLSIVQANLWTDDQGNQPFGRAPDTLTVQVCWKDLRKV